MDRIPKIVVLPGDGIGPEVTTEAVKVVKSTGLDCEILEYSIGGEEYLKTGLSLSSDVIDAINECDAVLFGAVGHDLVPYEIARQPLVYLRMEKSTYANVRPLKTYHIGTTWCKPKPRIDMVIIRDNSEGFSLTHEGELIDEMGSDRRIITNYGAKRIINYAFDYAQVNRRSKITGVDQSNWLYSDKIFRKNFRDVSEKCSQLHTEAFPVDSAAMMVSRSPEDFDVVVTPNLYGDILTGIVVHKIGGVGMAPSACVGKNFAYFEPVHGTAWDLAGKGIANPLASILSAKLMLEWLGLENEAWYVETSVKEVLSEGEVLTPDLGGDSCTSDVGDAVARRVAELEHERGAFEGYLLDISSNLISIEQFSVHQLRRTDVIQHE
jgi:isocitrate/isopropylmalate dehydrogenase